ncbi:MAG TPA: PQQ-dependent sugar dehydrogenase [Candidatus Paceibacterota bacterium]|nr:PQQ-dependent sugar dehydrogenase [Candidatus Paceibacterota bacterium]
MRVAAAVIASLVLLGGMAALVYWLSTTPRLQVGEMRNIGEELLDPSVPVAYEIEEVARGLEVPWSIVFTSENRMLVSERPGRIRVIENGVVREDPLHTFPDVSSRAEEGLMSLALHPQYDSTRWVYAVYAYASGNEMFDRVVRFRDEGDSISGLTIILDRIPAARFHAGSRLAFGPDGKLYVTTGDATNRTIAQDLDSLGGKILRLNDDGSIPSDNPFPNSPVWSYGHRNPQGIAWDTSGNLYETEHGPSGFDGPGGGDEVNRIVKGGNYGWPLVSHNETQEGTVAPLLVFTPAEAPGSALVYSGRAFPQFEGNLFFGALIGEGLIRVVIDENDADRIVRYEKLSDVRFGRIREVTEGPDGAIYFSTSNRDGRGDPAATDDRIFRMIPVGLE